jgi:hypothetical protein
MMKLLLAIACCATIGFAHNSYTGGYSSAPGRQTCASSCHGGTGGTLVVAGFPATYQPMQVYTITVRHNGGSRIVNFNATTRIGSTTTVAGTFTAGLNSTLYTGADGGVYASPHSIDSAIFQWTAPAAGAGTVNFYAAAFQGTTSSANGQSSRVTFAATEITTGVNGQEPFPTEFALSQNYPNPFNPTTNIDYELPVDAHVTLKIFDVSGKEVATIVDGLGRAGLHHVTVNAVNLASGLYFYRLDAGTYTNAKKFVVLK